jgi:hypothetical protein
MSLPQPNQRLRRLNLLRILPRGIRLPSPPGQIRPHSLMGQMHHPVATTMTGACRPHLLEWAASSPFRVSRRSYWTAITSCRIRWLIGLPLRGPRTARLSFARKMGENGRRLGLKLRDDSHAGVWLLVAPVNTTSLPAMGRSSPRAHFPVSADRPASNAKGTAADTQFHLHAGCRLFSMKLCSPGVTQLGICSAGLLPLSHHLSPIA